LNRELILYLVIFIIVSTILHSLCQPHDEHHYDVDLHDLAWYLFDLKRENL